MPAVLFASILPKRGIAHENRLAHIDARRIIRNYDKSERVHMARKSPVVLGASGSAMRERHYAGLRLGGGHCDDRRGGIFVEASGFSGGTVNGREQPCSASA
jgi:hypothetical protein